MVRAILVLTTALLCLGAARSDEIVGDLLSGRVDPTTYDYGVLRERPDADLWLRDAETRAQRGILRRHGVLDGVAWDDARYSDCMSEAEMALLKGLSSARKVTTHSAWLEARRQAAEGEKRRQAMADAVLAGEAAPYKQLKGVERRLRLSREAGDPVVSELFRRNVQDQLWRVSIGFSARQFMLQDLSEAALDLYDAKVGRETCLVDASNRAWIKQTIARRGWFKISVDGEQADSAAWNMVQHADKDLAFQREMLAVLEQALKTKDTSPSNYAYLWDRVAVNTGRPQRYATQGLCEGPGDWRPSPLENASAVDRLRAEFGIDYPLADYVALMNTFCR